MKSEKIRILKNAARFYSDGVTRMGMGVDRMYCPPSDRGEIKHLLRKGMISKVRMGLKKSRYSMVLITDKGLSYLEKHGK